MNDHDLLIRIDERTAKIEKTSEKRLNDHSDRLRELEQNQSKLMTIVVMVGAGITIAINAAIAIWNWLNSLNS